MEVQKKLLVLVDGSERSLLTVDYVGAVKAFADMKVVLFHVFSGIPEVFWDLEYETIGAASSRQMREWEEQRKRFMNAYMDRAKKRLIFTGFDEASIETVIHTRQKGVARDILKEAENGYRAVVLRRNGMGQLEGVAVGSVANKLIGKLDFLPVIVAGRKPPNSKVLIAVDGSPSATQTVDFVAENLGGKGYSVELYHVIRGLAALNPEYPEFMMPSESFREAESAMQHIFDRLTSKLIGAGFASDSVSCKIVTGMYSRAGAIVQEAESGGYNTAVVGRKGLSRVEAFFLGRVSSKVIQANRYLSVWII